jgi:hypothetical protein
VIEAEIRVFNNIRPLLPFKIGLMNGQEAARKPTSKDGAAPAATFEPLPL